MGTPRLVWFGIFSGFFGTSGQTALSIDNDIAAFFSTKVNGPFALYFYEDFRCTRTFDSSCIPSGFSRAVGADLPSRHWHGAVSS